MTITDQDLAERVIQVIRRCTGLSPDKLDTDHWKEPLTGYYYNLTATDLIYILLELEQEYRIKIPAEDLEEYGFSTIYKIYLAVEKVLSRRK